MKGDQSTAEQAASIVSAVSQVSQIQLDASSQTVYVEKRPCNGFHRHKQIVVSQTKHAHNIACWTSTHDHVALHLAKVVLHLVA